MINTFCLELPVFLREHFNGCYRTDVYFISKQLADLPTFVLAPAMFISILYWMVKLNPDAERFFICMAGMVMLTLAVNGFGKFVLCSGLVKSLDEGCRLVSQIPRTFINIICVHYPSLEKINH